MLRWHCAQHHTRLTDHRPHALRLRYRATHHAAKAQGMRLRRASRSGCKDTRYGLRAANLGHCKVRPERRRPVQSHRHKRDLSQLRLALFPHTNGV